MQDATSMPEHAADVWAEVYIDVAEKLDAEDQQASGANRQEVAVSSLNDALTTGPTAAPPPEDSHAN